MARTMLVMADTSFLLVACVADRAPDALRGGRHVDVADAELAERVDERIHHRRQRTGASGFAASLGAERVGGGWYRVEFVHEQGRVVGARHSIIHEGAGQQLP